MRDGLRDGSSDHIVDLFLNSLGWISSHIDGLLVEELSPEAEIVATSVSASKESLITALRVLLVLVSSEAQSGRLFLSTLLDLAFVLSQATRELVVIVGAALEDVLGGTV